ncbi:hypothetical protein MBAV_004344 [Candidatus Magnetobacterium bavaricum]|uniref:Uncharacterized protein n=1 Tax=Candidatus Magnetobacterium bavaricum TaxID=29290 RepID=A0A0F3GNS6_9BACT|nr:hypothetical protein MBAV_004344 [Candidatus Magnetobacterium bavaricum]
MGMTVNGILHPSVSLLRILFYAPKERRYTDRIRVFSGIKIACIQERKGLWLLDAPGGGPPQA